MRAGASLGLRIAAAVAFGATAALAVTLNRGAPMHAALTSEKGRGAPHTASAAPPASATGSPAAAPRCAPVGAAHLGGRRLPGDHCRHQVPARLHQRRGRAVHAHRLPGGGRLPGRRHRGRRRLGQGHRPSRRRASCSLPGRPRTRPWTPRCPPGAARSGSPGCASSRPASPRRPLRQALADGLRRPRCPRMRTTCVSARSSRVVARQAVRRRGRDRLRELTRPRRRRCSGGCRF